uniref:Uncharacterized protein n=1 Tax=Caenorhabditis japonica TaxID=281687 RepID=A0A8R1I4B7_CAEJA
MNIWELSKQKLAEYKQKAAELEQKLDDENGAGNDNNYWEIIVPNELCGEERGIEGIRWLGVLVRQKD